MLLLRRSRHNVIRLCSRYYSSTAVTPAIQNDTPNTFITYSALTNAPVSSDGILPLKLAVKDNIVTSDLPITCASNALEGFRSPYEATVVTLLKQAGATVVGKTNMDEFGMGSHSTNSRFGAVSQRGTGADGIEFEYSVGGSSGGSALAVKNGHCDIALGTDTGGSVRLPAAWCGVVGFKPSYGLVSRWGVIDYANSFDTVGFFAREIKQIRKMFDITAKYDEKDPTSLKPNTIARMLRRVEALQKKEYTIGVPLEYNIAELSPVVKNTWNEALQACQSAGHKIVSVSLPSTRSALSAYYVLAPAEASSNLARYDGVRYGSRADGPDGLNGVLYSNTRSRGFGSEVKRRILLGSYSLSADAMDNYFIQAQKVRRLVQTEFNDVFARPHPLLGATEASEANEQSMKVDFILCPTAPTSPPRLKDIANQTPVEAYINDVFTVPASMAGLPAISVPWGTPNETGPSGNVGLQLIGQFGQDRQVLDLAEEMLKLRSVP